jgi:mannose-6-phosphate isomerase-like protein (cupin superfamily)
LKPRAKRSAADNLETIKERTMSDAAEATHDIAVPDEEMLKRHQAAEATVKSYHYEKPSGGKSAKGRVNLGKSDNIRGVVQIVKKNGGENNLHYHTTTASFWLVLKGRVRFYGPGDVLIGEFGPHEGTITQRYARYWFENCGEDDLEILHVAAYAEGANDSGRTDAAPQRYKLGTAQKFDAVT